MITSDEALDRLIEGNGRFVSFRLQHPNRGPETRAEVAKGQNPFAIVVGCSDSRVPPEIIFDQGIGDIFVVRTAGNVVDDLALGSIEYAVERLRVPLIVVMGHKRCGAVEATVKGVDAPGHIKQVIETIRPVIETAKDRPGDIVENAVKANIESTVAKLNNSRPILASKVRSGKLKVVGAYYDLDDGRVVLL